MGVSMSFEELEHTADVRIRIRADSHEELFARAAEALFEILYPGECRVEDEMVCDISGDDPEELLWDFLSELIYISDVESFVVCETDVQFTENGLSATLKGEPFNRERHGGGREVKGVSYSGLFIRQMDDMICSEILFDI